MENVYWLLVEDVASSRVEVTVITTGVLETRLVSDEVIVTLLDETEYQAVFAAVGLNVNVSVIDGQAASAFTIV